MYGKTPADRLRFVVLTGLLSALVFALSALSIPIPIPLGPVTRIHTGNLMCLLGGLLFGPWAGGLSAGIGSMLFDLSKPEYAAEFWITFFTKFCMGFLAGWLNSRLPKPPGKIRPVLSALAASLLYVCLYLGKTALQQYFIYVTPLPGIWVILTTAGTASLINAAIAVIGSSVLYAALHPALAAAPFFSSGEKPA